LLRHFNPQLSESSKQVIGSCVLTYQIQDGDTCSTVANKNGVVSKSTLKYCYYCSIRIWNGRV
jgi:hypothetical protein